MDRQIDGRIGGRINRGTERHTEKVLRTGWMDRQKVGVHGI